MTNGLWGVCRSAPPIPEPKELKNRYFGAGGADFDKGDFVTGFLYPRSAERPRRGRSEPLRDVLPCASSFAIETGSREHKPTGTVVSKCALLYRSGVRHTGKQCMCGHKCQNTCWENPNPINGKAGFTENLLTTTGAGPGGPSARCGGDPGVPFRTGRKDPLLPGWRRGSIKCRPVSAYEVTNH